MTTQEIVSKLWNLCNVLRDDGITYHQYVTELTYILFLKMAKETGAEKQIPEAERKILDAVKRGIDKAVKEEAKSQNMKTELITNVSHDLKTPLTMIKAYAEMTRDFDELSNEKRKENLKNEISKVKNRESTGKS